MLLRFDKKKILVFLFYGIVIYFLIISPLGIDKLELKKLLNFANDMEFEDFIKKYEIIIDKEDRINCKESLKNLKRI